MESPMATLTRKSSAKAHKPFANYSHVVTAQGANKLVFCAGQVAADAAGKVLWPRRRDALGPNSHSVWGAPGDSRSHLINSTVKDLFLPLCCALALHIGRADAKSAIGVARRPSSHLRSGKALV